MRPKKRFISHLRQELRVAVRVKSKLQKNSISKRKVLEVIKEFSFNKKTDTIVLFYDMDNSAMNHKLQVIQTGFKSNGYKVLGIWSNPVVELWYLLHFETITASISNNDVFRKLEKHWPNYKKGKLKPSEINDLLQNIHIAKLRAERLTAQINPSSLVWKLVNKLN